MANNNYTLKWYAAACVAGNTAHKMQENGYMHKI